MVEIYNTLPGTTEVKKFKDRATAVSRMWKALQTFAESAPVAEEANPEPTPGVAATAVEQLDPTPLPETVPETPVDTPRNGATRRQQDQPGNRHGEARGRSDARGGYARDGMAEAHDAGHAQRGGLADEESLSW